VQKLTELGIDEIVLLAPTSRSVVRWDAGRANKNLERLRSVAREASMQSRRVWLPKIDSGVALTQLSGAFIADPNGVALDASHRTLAIGPEGGFADEELNAGQGLVSLGETVLRAETAAISAAVLMSNYRIKGS
jgi:16S rRNA (uracil1498-N3)-methyltransferase